MGRVVGVDFGTKRIGLAATDALRISVHGKGTYSPVEAIGFLRKFVEDEEVDEIVIGMPSEPSVEFNKGLETFVSKLRSVSTSIPIEFHDEDYTSSDAKKVLLMTGATKKQRRRKEAIDEISAILLLQDYLGHI